MQGTLAMQGDGYLPNMNTKTSETAVVLRGEVGAGRIGYMSEWSGRRIYSEGEGGR